MSKIDVAGNGEITIENELNIVDSVLSGIIKEIDPRKLASAEKRLGSGKHTRADIEILEQNLIALTAQSVVRRLSTKATSRLTSEEAISILAESELSPTEVSTIGAKLEGFGWLNPDESKRWESEIKELTTERNTWKEEATALMRYDNEAPAHQGVSPALMKDLLVDATAITSLSVLAETISPDQLLALSNNPQFAEKLGAILAEKGHLNPEEAAALNIRLAELSDQLQIKESQRSESETERTRAEAREADLKVNKLDLENKVSEMGESDTQLRLKIAELTALVETEKATTLNAYADRAELMTKIAQLEEAIKSASENTAGPLPIKERKTSAGDEKKSSKEIKSPPPDLDSLKKKWKLYADTLYGEFTVATPMTPEKMARMKLKLCSESIGETQAHFDTSGTSLSERPGLLMPLETFFGSTIASGSFESKDMDKAILEMPQSERLAIASLVEHFVKNPKLIEPLYSLITKDLSVGLQRESTYSASTYSERTWLTSIGDLVGNEEDQKRIRELFINIEDPDAKYNQLAALLSTLGQEIGDETISGWSFPIFNFSMSSYVASIKNLEKLAKPIDTSGKIDWTKQSRTEKEGEQAIEMIKSVRRLQKIDSKDRADVEAVLIKLSFAIDLANLHLSLPKDMRPNTKWNPVDNGISLNNARNMNSVMLSLAYDGQDPASLSDDYIKRAKWTFTSSKQSGWPPTPLKRAMVEELPKAMSHECPVSLELTRDRPIILLVGHNGAGKTHAMETLLQTLGVAEVTQTVHFGQLDSPRITNARGLIGATAHSDRLSSFQREATLLRNVFESLSSKKPGETAILAIDEVGKGTDSRDAIALMIAAAEFCRRRGIYLVMATHHGRDFLEVSEKLGLRKHMRVLSPDFKTHALKEYDSSVASEGIEVWAGRPKMLQAIKSEITSKLVDNAKNVRTAVLEGGTTRLSEVPFMPQNDVLSYRREDFVDSDSLKDMGYSAQNPGSLKYLAEKSWAAEKKTQNEKKAYSIFVSGFVGQMGTEYPTQAREVRIATLDRLTPLMKDLGRRSAVLNQGASVAILRASFDFDPNQIVNMRSGDDLTERSKRLQRLLTESSPLDASGLYLDGDTRKILQAWNSTVRDASAKDTLRRQSLQLAETLDEPAPDLATKIRGLVKFEQEFTAEQLSISNTRRIELTAQALDKSRNRNLYPVKSNLRSEDAKAIAVLLDLKIPDYAGESWVDANIVEPMRKGDTRVREILGGYVKDTMRESSEKRSLIRTLFPEEAIAEIVFTKIESTGKLEDFRKWLKQDGVIISPGTTEAKSSFVSSVDPKHIENLIRAMDFLQANGMSIYGSYGIEETAAKLQAFIGLTQIEEITSWQTAVAGMIPSDATLAARKDMYAVLNNHFGADHASLRQYSRDAERAGHEDAIRHLDIPESEKRERVLRRMETSVAWGWLDTAKRATYDKAATLLVAEDLGFYLGVTNAHQELKMVTPERSDDGTIEITGALPIGLLTTMAQSAIVPQNFSLDAEQNVAVIGGANGNGKSQLLQAISGVMLWDKATGKVPAKQAILPRSVPFIMSAINAGETSETQSSWQNEADRLASLLERYVNSGSPEGGVLFFDEPGAGTSSEDQIGVLLSLVGMFAQRNVKVIFTNHNHRMYDRLRNTSLPNGDLINFKPLAFLHSDDLRERFTPQIFATNRTDEIRSDGLKVATQFGVPVEITQLAKFVREFMEGRIETELKTDVTSDEILGLFNFGKDQDSLARIPEQIDLTAAATERLLEVALKELQGLSEASDLTESPLLDSLVKPVSLMADIKSSNLDIRLAAATNCYSILDQNYDNADMVTEEISESARGAMRENAIAMKIRKTILTNIQKARKLRNP